jgi:hypothetical protein
LEQHQRGDLRVAGTAAAAAAAADAAAAAAELHAHLGGMNCGELQSCSCAAIACCCCIRCPHNLKLVVRFDLDEQNVALE